MCDFRSAHLLIYTFVILAKLQLSEDCPSHPLSHAGYFSESHLICTLLSPQRGTAAKGIYCDPLFQTPSLETDICNYPFVFTAILTAVRRISPCSPPGVRSRKSFDHFYLLYTEQIWQLSNHPHNTPSLHPKPHLACVQIIS